MASAQIFLYASILLSSAAWFIAAACCSEA
ncbi:MAG: sortase B protein-sorting domain-containing protein [Lentisphaeria bacterium]|nr:sortase B protein-sorting domain-containing protein [Lentisphaeria bacterium]